MWFSKKIPLSYGAISLAVFLTAVGFIWFSQGISQGVIRGLSLCGQILIPSLFVFLCFCEFGCLSGGFQRAFSILNPVFKGLMGKLYLGGTGLLLCLLGGYPMGASALKSLEEQGELSAKQLQILSLWIFCPSPSFVITGVGMGMLHSFKAGVVLWISCAASCVISGSILCRIKSLPDEKTKQSSLSVSFSETFVKAISNAVNKMLQICGVVILVAGVLGGLSVVSLPSAVNKVFHLFLEVTNATSYLANNGGSMAQIGAVLMFGGIGTHLQCKMLLGRSAPSYIPYLLVRVFQTILCYVLCDLFCRWFPWVVPTLSNGMIPTVGNISVVPSLWLMGTCLVFLCSLHQMPFGRRDFI